MMRKHLCMLLAILMLMATFAGCSGKTETAVPSVVPEVSAAPPSTAAPASPEVSQAPEELVYTGPAMELTVNLNAPEEQSPQYMAAFNRITERTGGKVTFVYYFSGSLLTAKDALEGLGAGMADFSDVALANFKDQFPYTQQVVSYPFMGFNSLPMAADVINDVVLKNELMMNEFSAVNIQPIFFVGVWGTAIALTKDIEISTPETIAGLKLVTDNPDLSRFLNDNGATPIGQPPMEYYTSMTNGVADGVINGLNVINIFGSLQPAKCVYMFDNSVSTGIKAICANLNTWNSFDDTLKAIVMDELQYSEKYWEDNYVWWTTSDQSHLDKAKEWGIPVRYIKGDAMKAWADGLKPYGDASLQALYDRGYTEVFNILDIWNEAIANYDGKYSA